jgi:CheY-like chemotaxis protein
VHGAVTDLGGAIDVQTVPGQGSTFTLMLPTMDPQEQEDDVLASASVELPLGQGQIVLLVDDEPALVALGEELLAALGYEPVGFTSAQTALDAIQREPQRFDLLLTDQVMPGMNGLELTHAVMAIRPNLPVLLATGYGGSDFEEKALFAGVTQVLAKPLTKTQLACAIDGALRRALGRAGGAS